MVCARHDQIRRERDSPRGAEGRRGDVGRDALQTIVRCSRNRCYVADAVGYPRDRGNSSKSVRMAMTMILAGNGLIRFRPDIGTPFFGSVEFAHAKCSSAGRNVINYGGAAMM